MRKFSRNYKNSKKVNEVSRYAFCCKTWAQKPYNEISNFARNV